MKTYYWVVGLAFLFQACNTPQPSQTTETASIPVSQASFSNTDKPLSPPEFDACIKAHGGVEKWRSYGTLEFDLVKGEKSEHQLIDLYSRKVLLKTDDYTIGYDGAEVWLTPDKEAFGGSARFYHNLYFYFFAIPFVFEDPGVNRKYEGKKAYNGVEYDVVSISFDDGVGDASNDAYIMYINPETKHLNFLLYTVTYRSGKPADRYNALVYEGWKKVDGLMIPQKLTSYKWDGEKMGEKRGESNFVNVSFKEDVPEASVFAKPTGAYVDELPQRN